MRFPIFGTGSAAAPDWRDAMTAKRNAPCHIYYITQKRPPLDESEGGRRVLIVIHTRGLCCRFGRCSGAIGFVSFADLLYGGFYTGVAVGVAAQYGVSIIAGGHQVAAQGG